MAHGTRLSVAPTTHAIETNNTKTCTSAHIMYYVYLHDVSLFNMYTTEGLVTEFFSQEAKRLKT